MQNRGGYKAIEIVLEHSPRLCCPGVFFCAEAVAVAINVAVQEQLGVRACCKLP